MVGRETYTDHHHADSADTEEVLIARGKSNNSQIFEDILLDHIKLDCAF